MQTATSWYERSAALFAMKYAQQKQEALEAVSYAATVDAGRPALRIVDGDLANEPPRLRRPSGELLL
jgi:hypothetical protein